MGFPFSLHKETLYYCVCRYGNIRIGMCVGMTCAEVTTLTQLESYMMLENSVHYVPLTTPHHHLKVHDMIQYY